MNLLLFNLTNEYQYKDAISTHVNGWAGPNPTIKRTPKGLSYVMQWGSLRVACT